MGGAGVILGAGGGEKVEGDAQPLPGLQELLVEAGRDLFRGQPLRLGANGDGGAVLVAAGDHENAVAAGAVVAGEDVGREVGADNLARVQGAVGVGPGHADEYLFGHGTGLDCSIPRSERRLRGRGADFSPRGQVPPPATCGRPDGEAGRNAARPRRRHAWRAPRPTCVAAAPGGPLRSRAQRGRWSPRRRA